MEKYEGIALEIVAFKNEDVITASCPQHSDVETPELCILEEG